MLTTELGAEIKGLKEELSYYQNALYELGQKESKKDATAHHCQEGFGIAKCQVLTAKHLTSYKETRIHSYTSKERSQCMLHIALVIWVLFMVLKFLFTTL